MCLISALFDRDGGLASGEGMSCRGGVREQAHRIFYVVIERKVLLLYLCYSTASQPRALRSSAALAE